MILKTGFLFCFSLFAFSGFQSVLAQKSETPNVIYINADDLGYGDLGVYGAIKVKTPNIDKLASQGVRFTDAHSVSAVCTPSRYALITGEYPFRNNQLTHAIFSRDSLIIDTKKWTIAKVFKKEGYATACIGKWHLGFGTKKPVDWNNELKPGPLELGFDYYFGVPVVNSHPPFVYVRNHKVVGLTEDDPMVYGKDAETGAFPEKWNRGDQKLGGAKKAHQLYKDNLVGTTLKDEAISWIKSHRDTPFFLYFAPTNIHHPFTPANRFLGTSDAGKYGDFIHELDWIVGEIMRTLELEGLDGKTLIIFTSDNGGMLNQGGQQAYAMGHHMNGNLLGFKFDAWEGGHRVPFIVKWDGHISPGSVSGQLLSHVDMLATFSALFDQELPDGQAVDSYNMLPAILNTENKSVRQELVLAPDNLNNIALRQGNWIYISGQGGGGFTGKYEGLHHFGGPSAMPFTGQKNSDVLDGQIIEKAPPAQLYNLNEDLSETQNLFDQYPEKAKAMKQRLKEIQASSGTRY